MTHICQDYSKPLSRWFASRLDARHVLRRIGEERIRMTTPTEARKLAEFLRRQADHESRNNERTRASMFASAANQVEQQAARIAELEAQVQRVPFGHFFMVNGVHERFYKGESPPDDDTYDEGTLVPLYTNGITEAR